MSTSVWVSRRMHELKHLVVINAPADAVYRAIAEQAGLAGWWTTDTVAEPAVDSIAEVRFGDRYLNRMRIARLDPDSHVEWVCLDGDREWIDTTFTFDLEARGDQTIVRFEHGNWRHKKDFFANCNTHWGAYMRSLKSYCETGTGDPFTDND